MKHRVRPSFWRLYRALPEEVRELADKNYALLEANPRHPSLRLKKVGVKQVGGRKIELWSARVGLDYRAVAVAVEDGLSWVWIGPHDEYGNFIS